MKSTEMRKLGAKELQGKHSELRLELIKLNAQVARGTNPKSPGQIKQIKKGIARILTELKQKENTQ